MSKIVAGTVFDTPFERGCVAVTAPDNLGCFNGLDSDGVLCQFNDPAALPGTMPLMIRGDNFRGWDEEGHHVVVGWENKDGTEYLIALTKCCFAAATCDEMGHMVCKGCYQDCSPSCGMEATVAVPPNAELRNSGKET